MKKETLTESQMSENIAANLRYLRTSKTRLSQNSLARILHISRQTIANYEGGRTMPSAYNIYLLSRYMDCEMEDLLTKKLMKG